MRESLAKLLVKVSEEQEELNPKYPVRNYEKQETCDHQHIKIFAKCTCSKCLSENNEEELIEILQRRKNVKIIEVKL